MPTLLPGVAQSVLAAEPRPIVLANSLVSAYAPDVSLIPGAYSRTTSYPGSGTFSGKLLASYVHNFGAEFFVTITDPFTVLGLVAAASDVMTNASHDVLMFFQASCQLAVRDETQPFFPSDYPFGYFAYNSGTLLFGNPGGTLGVDYLQTTEFTLAGGVNHLVEMVHNVNPASIDLYVDRIYIGRTQTKANSKITKLTGLVVQDGSPTDLYTNPAVAGQLKAFNLKDQGGESFWRDFVGTYERNV